MDQEAQEDRAYAKSRNALVDQQGADRMKREVFEQHVDYFAGGMPMDKVISSLSSQGYGQVDPSIPEKIQAMVASRPQQAGYTLGPGQTRFDAGGNVIAEVAPAPKQFAPSAPVRAVNDQGVEVWMSREEAMGRSPGAAQTQDPTRERKINDYLSMGMDWDVAVKLADGRLRVEQTDTGYVRMIDEVTGEVVELPIGQQPTAVAPTPGGEPTLWQATELGTGPVSAARDVASTVSGMFGGPVAEKTIQSRQRLNLATRDLVRSLAVNPRFPVAEIQQIQRDIATSPALFDNPPAMRQRMIELGRYLTRQEQNSSKDAADPTLPPDTRKAQAQNASAVRTFLEILGVPDDIAPPGVPQHIWNLYTPEEKEEHWKG